MEDENLLRRIRAGYYGMITQIDTHLGRLFAEMDKLGVNGNTAIVFTSDHGEYLGDHYMIEKELFYEQAVRVPLVVKIPGMKQAGARIEPFVELIDLLPTCLEASGLPIAQGIEGKSLLPLMEGTARCWRQEVFAEWDFQYYHVRRKLGLQPHECKAIMVRDKRWKYVHYTHQPCELYDLEQDPDEFHNLAASPEHRDKIAAYKEKILNWRMQTEDQKPEIDLTFATYLRDPDEGR